MQQCIHSALCEQETEYAGAMKDKLDWGGLKHPLIFESTTSPSQIIFKN